MWPFHARITVILAIISLTFVSWNSGLAQGRQAGEIRGTVADATGARMQDVKVTLMNVATGVSETTTTDASGVYDIPFIQPGDYAITFAKDSFKTLTRSGITLHVETISVNATLEVGMASEKVSVVAEAPLLQTETGEKSTTFGSELVSSAPSILSLIHISEPTRPY